MRIDKTLYRVTMLLFLINTLFGTEYNGSSFSLVAENVSTGTLSISDVGTITDLNVLISGNNQSNIGYLSFKLISPYGTIVDLVTEGWSGDAFNNTTFDDEASSAISSGTAPYFGSFQPAGSLADFDQEEMQGTWTLWAYNNNGYLGSISEWSIRVILGYPDPPEVHLLTNITAGEAPLFVQFSDASIEYNPIVNWEWDFGDGTVSNLQNPAHTYLLSGIYSVSLTVTDLYELTDTETRVNLISISDTTPPTVSIATLDSALIGQETQLSWIAEDNTGFRSHHLSFSSETGQDFAIVDSVDGSNGTYIWTVPNVVSETARLSILSYDLVGLTDTDTTEIFMIIDRIPPQVSVLTPTVDSSIPEYNNLTVTWLATDNIALDSLSVNFSNDGITYLLKGVISHSVQEFTFSVPPGVTDSARIKIDVMDVAGNLAEGYSEYFSITDNSKPIISHFSIPDSSTFGIGSGMDIQVSAFDNVQVTGLDLNYTINDGVTWVPIVQGLFPVEERPTYSWLIPDIPGDCQLQAIITDAVALTDTAYSDLFTIIVEYPILQASLVQIGPGMDMQLHFSQAMETGLSSGIEVVGSVAGVYVTEGTANGKDIAISALNGFVSLDTLMLVLAASEWTNAFGYGLDGNGDGVYDGSPIDNDTSYTYVSAAGDYDQNGILNFDDFDDFVIAWNNDVSEYELAPHQGEIPYINIQPDSSFDIFDLATFASMWNWAAGISLSAPLTESYQYKEFISEQSGNELKVSLSISDYVASQTIIKYDPDVVQISVADAGLAKVSANVLSLVDVNPDSGFILITSSHLTDFNDDDLKLKLVPNTKQRYSIEIAFQGSDMDANIVQKRSLIELLPIPTSFSLSQNYPNPFNASTTIEYGLPKNSVLSISIYDIRGRFVKDIYSGEKQAGYHFIQWNGSDDSGRNVASGLYFIVLNTPEYRVARKALILK
jgi:PKD repeat protein